VRHFSSGKCPERDAPIREWQKPTGAQLDILSNLKNVFQPNVPTVPLPTIIQQKQLMATVAGHKFYEKKKINSNGI